MEYDIFISHASEDKNSIATDLTTILVKIGCKVWYDGFSLKIGDSLSKSIDNGLLKSNFGLVILSKNFFSKKWTEYELRGLIVLDTGKNKKILPLLHGIDIKKVIEHSPTLADRISLSTKSHTIGEIALKVIEVIRPDIFLNYTKTRIAEGIFNSTKADWFDILRKVNPRTELPAKLSSCQIVRLRIIRGSLYPFLSHLTISEWFDMVSHQEDPELEILWWENIIAIWIEFSRYKQIDDDDFFTSSLSYIMNVKLKRSDIETRLFESSLSKKDKKVFNGLMNGPHTPYWRKNVGPAVCKGFLCLNRRKAKAQVPSRTVPAPHTGARMSGRPVCKGFLCLTARQRHKYPILAQECRAGLCAKASCA